MGRRAARCRATSPRQEATGPFPAGVQCQRRPWDGTGTGTAREEGQSEVHLKAGLAAGGIGRDRANHPGRVGRAAQQE
eukprot:12609717-Alexandrium_andersonii.AAC.1